MKLKEQKINNKEFKWSTKYIKFISKIKQHIQEKHQQAFDYIYEMRSVNFFKLTYKTQHTTYGSLLCEIAKKSA